MDEEVRNFFKLSTDAVFEVFGSGQCHLLTEKHMPSALRSGLIYHMLLSVYSCNGKSWTSESWINYVNFNFRVRLNILAKSVIKLIQQQLFGSKSEITILSTLLRLLKPPQNSANWSASCIMPVCEPLAGMPDIKFRN